VYTEPQSMINRIELLAQVASLHCEDNLAEDEITGQIGTSHKEGLLCL